MRPKTIFFSFVFFLSLAASSGAEDRDNRGYFVGYETLEMAMNRFRYFAGEVGYRYEPGRQVRLIILEVKLTEEHLSSGWQAHAVDGSHVEGYFRGYELSHDWFFSGNWYASANLGYFNDRYEHQITKQKINNSTMTLGTGVGYFKPEPFGWSHAYFHFSMPIRYYLNGIDETKMGNTTIRPHRIVDNIWFFIGYSF